MPDFVDTIKSFFEMSEESEKTGGSSRQPSEHPTPMIQASQRASRASEVLNAAKKSLDRSSRSGK